MAQYIEVRAIGPLRPFLFTHSDFEGKRKSIVLYGTDWYSVWENCRDQLLALIFEGEVAGYVLDD